MKVTILERESERVKKTKEGAIEGDFGGKWRIMDGICEICEKIEGFE